MTTRLNVNINDETAAALRKGAHQRGTTVTEVLRRAVSVYVFMVEAQDRGDRIQLTDGDRITEVREIL